MQFSVQVEAKAVGYVDVEAESAEEAEAKVEGMEIAHVCELYDFEVKGADRV